MTCGTEPDDFYITEDSRCSGCGYWFDESELDTLGTLRGVIMSDEGVEITIYQAPDEVRAYLAKLVKVVGYQEPVEVATIAHADMPKRVGVTDNPHGFLHIVPGRVPLIVMSDAYVDDPRWQSLIAHEFLHLLRWTTDWWVLWRLPESEHAHYLRLVEGVMKPLSILLMVGGMINAEWVEEEPNP